jgi:hypothetical protein
MEVSQRSCLLFRRKSKETGAKYYNLSHRSLLHFCNRCFSKAIKLLLSRIQMLNVLLHNKITWGEINKGRPCVKNCRGNNIKLVFKWRGHLVFLRFQKLICLFRYWRSPNPHSWYCIHPILALIIHRKPN